MSAQKSAARCSSPPPPDSVQRLTSLLPWVIVCGAKAFFAPQRGNCGAFLLPANQAAPAAGSAHAGCPQLQAISVLLPASWHDVLQYLLPDSAGQLQAGWAHLLPVLAWADSCTFILHLSSLGLFLFQMPAVWPEIDPGSA